MNNNNEDLENNINNNSDKYNTLTLTDLFKHSLTSTIVVHSTSLSDGFTNTLYSDSIAWSTDPWNEVYEKKRKEKEKKGGKEEEKKRKREKEMNETKEREGYRQMDRNRKCESDKEKEFERNRICESKKQIERSNG